MSEEIALAAADLETVRQLRAALEVAMQENEGHRELERKAAVEIARLHRAMRQAARMFTIKGARKIIEDAIGVEP